MTIAALASLESAEKAEQYLAGRLLAGRALADLSIELKEVVGQL
jgi:hypothetical protein